MHRLNGLILLVLMAWLAIDQVQASATSLTVTPPTVSIASAVTDDRPGEQPLSEGEATMAFIVLLVSIVLLFTRIRWLLFFWLIAYLIFGDIALIAILSVVLLLWMGVKSIFGGTDC